MTCRTPHSSFTAESLTALAGTANTAMLSCWDIAGREQLKPVYGYTLSGGPLS
jgi:hypothetical protein